MGTAFITAVEAIPDAEEVGRVDADAVVADVEADFALGELGGDFDAAAVGGVFDGVVEEVAEEELEAVAVGGDFAGGVDLGGDGDAFVLRDVVVELDEGVDDGGEGEGFEVELEGAGLDFGDVHDGAEHGVEALGFLDGVGERFLDLLGVFVLEGELRAGLETGERRAKIVRDVVERAAHRADEGLVVGEHPVEERDELVDFVLGARVGHAAAEVAGLDDGADGGDDLPDGAERAVRDESADAEGEADHGDDDEEEDGAEMAEEFVAILRWCGRPP